MKKIFENLNKAIILLIFLAIILHTSIIVLKKIKKENLYYILLSEQQKKIYNYLTKDEVNDLLKSTWYRKWEYVSVLGFREGPLSSKFVNVNSFGVRSNSKNQVTYSDINDSVWFFGGSSTFGYGVSDNDTIPSNFEKISDIKVINFGTGFYYSFQENYLLKKMLKTHKPKYVIFLDGHNESCKITPYQKELKQLFKNSQNTYAWELTDIFEPFLFYLNKIIRKKDIERIKSNPWKTQLQDCNINGNVMPLTQEVDRNLKERNAICKFNLIDCYTFLQPFPRIHVPHQDKVRLSDIAAESMKELYYMLKPIVKANGGYSLENLVFDSKKHYYVDASHYSRDASKIIAKGLLKQINR